MFIRTQRYMMVGRTVVQNGATVPVNAVEGKELVQKGYAVEVAKLDNTPDSKPTKAELAKVEKSKDKAEEEAAAELAKAEADATAKAEEDAKAKADAEAAAKVESEKTAKKDAPKTTAKGK